MFSELFNKDEFKNFEKFFNLIKEKTQEYDWELLKTLGTVEEKTETKEGFITTTRSYVSKDGKTSIMVSSSVPEVDATKAKISLLNNAIEKAVSEENYLKAAELKAEKDKLLKNGK